MGIQFKNNAAATLATAIGAGSTEFSVSAGYGSRFPSAGAGDYFMATLFNENGDTEVVKVTARSGDVFTVERAKEGTAAAAWAATTTRIECRVTAGTLDILRDAAATADAKAELRTKIADLADTTDTAKGAALVGFKHSATGAMARTIRARMLDWVFITDFSGVDPTGVSDSTTGMQAAINYALSVGRRLYSPAGTYKYTQLTIAVDASGIGPLILEGDGTPFVQFGTRGTIWRQADGTTGTAITVTGDWANSKSVMGLQIKGMGFHFSNALTGWGIDMFNVTGFHSLFEQVALYVPYSGSAGAWRQRSCWCVTMRNVRGDGPSSGTTSKGLVIYGDAGTGTTNQTVLENINFVGFGKANVQIGKHDESGGGVTQGIVWNGGQAGSGNGYGVVIGRVFDYTIMGVHTENNQKSGWMFTESANGADNGYGTVLNCDSYDDAQGGASDSDGDAYAIQIKRGSMVNIDGFRLQETKRGLYVADTTQVTDITVDRILFGGKSNNTDSRTAIYIANGTPSNTKRVTFGSVDFAYTWGNGGTNVIENGDCISWVKRTDAHGQRTTSTGTEEIFPWTEEVSLAPTSVGISGAADNGSGLVRLTTASAHGLSTSDVVRVWCMSPNAGNGAPVGTIEANGVWTVTVIDGTHIDLQGSTFTNTYGSSSFDRVGKIRELTDFVAATNLALAQGQLLTVNCGGGNIKFVDVNNGGNFYLKDGRDYIPDNRDSLMFHLRGGVWYEINRSVLRYYLRNNGGVDETFTVREYGTATSITVTNMTQVVELNHASPTNLNTLADATGREATQNQVVRLVAKNGNTTLKDASGGGSAKFRLAGGGDLPLGTRDSILVMRVGTEWWQVGYNNN